METERQKLSKIYSILILGVFISILPASGMSRIINLDVSELTFENTLYGVIPMLPGMELRGEPGTPLLPVLSVVFELPPGATEVEFNIIPLETEKIPGNINIAPAGELLPFVSGIQHNSPIPSPAIYGRDRVFPVSPVISSHIGTVAGTPVASCLIQPFEYIPAEGRLSLISSFEITVEWEYGGEIQTLTETQTQTAEYRLSQLTGVPFDGIPFTMNDGGSAQYLIISDEDYIEILAPLAEHHASSGLTVETVTVQDLLVGYPGRDDAERLRNCLKDYYANHGTVFVLLAGDETLVPVRLVELYCEGWSDVAPVDLYFADLDGTWDGNGDWKFGQPDDNLDLYADVLLSRALFSDSTEAELFVQKNLTYQINPPPGGWSTHAMLCGAVLFEEIGYTSAKGCDSIAAAISYNWEISKAYEELDGDGFDTHIPVISDGTGFNHYAGHGNERGIYWHRQPLGMMTNWIAEDSLHNGEKAGIHTSIACMPGDYYGLDCCAEALLNAPNGGGVAVMFNTSYGWEGHWPSIGPSEWMCIDYARQVFRYHASTTGLAFATAKDLRIPWMHEGYDRTFQSLLAWTSFGDPALQVIGVPNVNPIPPIPLTISAPYPNPAERDAPVSFFVDYSGGYALVSIHDLAGRLLWEDDIFVRQRVSWSGNTPAGDRVHAGVYIITVKRGDFIRSRLVTILN